MRVDVMEKKIIEGNKLIAEFMGCLKRSYVIEGRPLDYLVNGYWTIPYKLQYHTSWDWLMPVVEKINETGVFRVYIHFGGNGTNPIYYCYVEKIEWINRYPNITKICGKSGVESSIKVVWLTIVEFLNWLKITPPAPGKN